jgi:small subunit ribosomal protein S6
MARDYELGVVINPEVGDEQARAVVDRVTAIITANNGQVVRVNAWGRRRLAYPIERRRDGLYFFYDLILDPQSIVAIERDLKVNEDIMRHLLKLRDSRVVAQQRQRDIERDAELAQQQAEAAARAEAAEAEAAARGETGEAGEMAPAEVVDAASEPPAHTAAREQTSGDETGAADAVPSGETGA